MTIRPSIVICTYDRYDVLPICLDALHRDVGSLSEQVEVLVVDNTPPSSRKPFALPDGFKLHLADRPGLSNARNIGVETTSGDVIVFLDDDATVHPGYVDALKRGFDRAPGAMVMGGKTVAAFPDATPPAWFSDKLLGYLSCIDLGGDLRPLKAGEFVVGANVAFRREVFEKFGLFDVALGRTGSKNLLSNEEIELLQKVGLEKVYYNPLQVVDHHIPRSRLSAAWFRKRVYWQAISDLVGDMRYTSNEAALREIGEIQMKLPPNKRGLGFLHSEPGSPDEMIMQIRLIYLTAMLGSDGYPTVSA